MFKCGTELCSLIVIYVTLIHCSETYHYSVLCRKSTGFGVSHSVSIKIAPTACALVMPVDQCLTSEWSF
jgi:hypothetical protein